MPVKQLANRGGVLENQGRAVSKAREGGKGGMEPEV